MELYSVGDIFDSAPDGVLLSQNGVVSYLNTACLRLLSSCGVTLKVGDPLPVELTELPEGQHLVLLEGGLLTADHRPFSPFGETGLLFTLRSPQPKGEVSRQFELLARNLRAPLSAALSTLDRMEARPQEDHSHRLASLRRSQYRLMHTINELQLLSNLCVEDPVVTLVPLDLTGLLRELFREAEGFLRDFPISLTLEQTADLMIQGNTVLLRQLLLGLLSNAIAGGSDRLTLSSKKAGRQALITLRDNGRGISSQQLAYARYPLLTQSEYHSQLSAGLPICSRIAQLHGGSLLIQSDETGTLCTLTFPLISNSEAPEALPLGSPPFGTGCEDLFIAMSEVVPDQFYALDHLD